MAFWLCTLKGMGMCKRGLRPGKVPGPPPAVPCLLDLDLAAGVGDLLDDGVRVGLVDAFLDRLRCAVDQVLGFLEPQAGDLANGLDHVDLVLARGGLDHGELGLLFGCWCGCTATGSRPGSRN